MRAHFCHQRACLQHLKMAARRLGICLENSVDRAEDEKRYKCVDNLCRTKKYDGEQIEPALCVQCAAVCVIFQGLCQNAGKTVRFGTMSQKFRRAGGLEDEDTSQGGGHDGQPGSISRRGSAAAPRRECRSPLVAFFRAHSLLLAQGTERSLYSYSPLLSWGKV